MMSSNKLFSMKKQKISPKTTATDLTGPVSQQLVPDLLLWLEAMQINFHIFQGSSISKSSILGG